MNKVLEQLIKSQMELRRAYDIRVAIIGKEGGKLKELIDANQKAIDEATKDTTSDEAV